MEAGVVSNPIRVATAVLSERIYAGRPTKDGKGFKEPRYDVTSDVLQAIRDKVGIGNQVNVECNGVVEFRIAVLPPEPAQGGVTRTGQDREAGLVGEADSTRSAQPMRPDDTANTSRDTGREG